MKSSVSRAVRGAVALLAALPPAMGLVSTAPAAAQPADTVVLPAVYETTPAMSPFASTGTVFASVDPLNGDVYRSTTGTTYSKVATGAMGYQDVQPGFLWWVSGQPDGPGTLSRLSLTTGVVSRVPYTGFVVAVNATGRVQRDWVTNTLTYFTDAGTAIPMGPPALTSIDSTSLLTGEPVWNSATSSYDTIIRLRPLTGGTPRLVASFSGEIAGMVLTPNSIVWLRDVQGAIYLQRQPRSGGTTTSVQVPVTGYTHSLAATDSAALVEDSPTCFMYQGVTRVAVTPPAGDTLDCGAAMGAGGKILARAQRRGSGAGVYSIDPATGASTKVASPPPSLARVDLDLNGGRLYGTDTKDVLDSRRIWSRSVGATVGAETLFPQRATSYGMFEFTGNRAWLSGVANNGTRLFEGSTLVKDWATLFPRAASGPNVLVSTTVNLDTVFQVRRSDGLLLWSKSQTEAAWGDIFGSRLVWEQADGTIWLHDLAKPTSASNPKVVRASQCATWCVSPVSIWGDLIVIQNTGSLGTVTSLSTINIATGAVGKWTGSPGGVRVTDGAVLFINNGQLYAWNGASGSAPVAVAPIVWWAIYAAENGKVAWMGPDGQIRVGSMPLPATSRPRVLGMVGTPSVFAPTVAGQLAFWRPQIDLTEDLTSWTWTLRQGTTVVRTLTGTTVNAAIRTLAWDGKDGTGALVGNGRYTWTLTGSAKDGSGAVAGVDGVSSVAGTIDVSTQAPAPQMLNPLVASSAGTSTTIPVSWTVTNPTANVVVSFDVQYRTVSRDAAGVRVVGAPTTWRAATTARSASFTAPAHSTWEFQTRAKDQFGRVSAWTPWKSTTFPWDDRELTTSGTWSDLTAATSWAGTSRSTTASGASLALTANTAQISVVGSRGPTSGSMRVYVDGTLVSTVDLYAATATVRDVLWTAAVPYGSHTVRVTNLPVSGRTLMAIDAVGFGL